MTILPGSKGTSNRRNPNSEVYGTAIPSGQTAGTGASGSILLALLTALLLVLSFPAPDLGALAWIALVPLMLACRDRTPAFSFSMGLLSGTATVLGTFSWIFQVPGFRAYHMIPATLYLALYPAIWSSTFAVLRQRGTDHFLYAATLWVALDWAKAHAGFLSLPWATLAHSQHHNLAGIQIAALTGEYGVTFLIVLGNMAIYEIITDRSIRKALAAGILILLAHLWGFHELSFAHTGPALKVAVVQPAIQVPERQSAAGRETALIRLEELTRRANESEPALIVWPETSVRALNMDSALFQRLCGLSGTLETPLLVGSSDFSKVLATKESAQDARYSFNSAYLLPPNAPPGEPYRKNLLVPFGEYLPLAALFRWPDWFVPDFVETRPGTNITPFTLPEGVHFSTMICWENLFPAYVRTLAENDSRLIVQLTNDAWFGKTAAPYQHNLASVLRAVENHIPIIQASNTGPSQWIDKNGRILAELPYLFEPGATAAELFLKTQSTFYSRFGDLFVYLALVISLYGLFPWSRRKKNSQHLASRRETSP